MRYDRQILLKEIGTNGQQKLEEAKVLVIGAGGLGSPVLTYLATSGVGEIRFIDHDIVSESNLNRQFLHTTNNLGQHKVDSALEKLSALNPSIKLIPIKDTLTWENASDIICGVDVVIDCVDNIETRAIVNHTCLQLDIPFVEGGVNGFYGFVISVHKHSACLSCIGYDHIQLSGITPIIGYTAGVIGSLQVNECIKIILNIGEPLYSKMLTYDGLRNSFDLIDLMQDKNCKQNHAYSLYAL